MASYIKGGFLKEEQIHANQKSPLAVNLYYFYSSSPYCVPDEEYIVVPQRGLSNRISNRGRWIQAQQKRNGWIMATILIMDDTAILAELIADKLVTAGYQTRWTAGAREALELVRSQRPDLVLLDPASEAGAGMRFLQALRADAQLAALPVVVLTGAMDRAVLLEAARLGVRHYLLKSKAPVKELLDRVGQCILAQPSKSSGTKPPSSAAPSTQGSADLPSAKEALPAKGPAQPTRLLTREQCLARAEKALQAKTLSGTVIQVIAMATSPRTDMSQLAEAIARDVVLSAKVLQVANSASYASGRGMIAGIPEAVRQIGCATIRNIAASVGVFEAMPETGADGFNPIRSWQHSFAVARLCEQLATGPMPEQAGSRPGRHPAADSLRSGVCPSPGGPWCDSAGAGSP